MTGQQLLRLRILWAALTLSTLVIGAIGYLQIGNKSLAAFDAAKLVPSFGGDQISQDAVMLVLGVIVVALSVIWPRFGAGARNRDKAGVPVFQRAFPPFVMGLALCEACALFGLVDVASFGGAAERAIAHAGLAAAVMGALHFPTDKRMIALVGGIL